MSTRLNRRGATLPLTIMAEWPGTRWPSTGPALPPAPCLDGLVLVGGTVTSNGNNSINGAIVSGLNLKIGIAVPQTAIGNGTKTFQFHSCNLTRALGHIGSVQRIRNGWTDTCSSY